GSAAHIPLVTQGFGPTTFDREPKVDWPGGEKDIFGATIPAKIHRHFHRALDISKGGCGTNVFAAAKGVVRRVEKLDSGAILVEIGHGLVGTHRFRTGYVHLQDPPSVKVDDHVAAGQVIGRIGNTGAATGASTGCHLHFYVKRNLKFVDPWGRLRQNTSVDPDL